MAENKRKAQCKLWYLHIPPGWPSNTTSLFWEQTASKNHRGGYDAASYAAEMLVQVIQHKFMLEVGTKSVRGIQQKDILVFQKLQGEIDEKIQYILKEVEAYFDQAIISAKSRIKKEHNKIYGKYENRKLLKSDEWISKIEQPGFDGKYGKHLTDEVRNAFMNEHVVPELSKQKSEFCRILKGKNFRQLLKATRSEKVVNTLSLAMVSAAHSSDILKFFDKKKNLPPQVVRSEDATIGNVQNHTTATGAAAHRSFVHPDAIQSSSSTTTDIVLPHHDYDQLYTYQNEVDLTCGDGESDDEERNQGPTTTSGSGIASMRGPTDITASDITNRVSVSPDHTQTAPMGTKSEQSREATHTTRVQKLERAYYDEEKNNYAISKRLIDLEVFIFGKENIGGLKARIQALEKETHRL